MKEKSETSISSKKKVFWILKNPEILASIVLIVAFFLPWFSNPIFTIPAYKIARVLDFYSIVQPVSGIIKVLTFLIPSGGILTIILSFLKKPTAVLAMILGILPIVVIVVLYFNTHFILNQLDVGSILTIIAAIALLIIGANK